jgi:hypothetical protein
MGLKINCALFLLLILFVTGNAQTCGTTASAAYMRTHYNTISSVSYQPHDTCLNKKLSILFHVVLDSSNNTGIVPSDLTTCVNNLNNYFKRICITFMNCSTNYIPNFNYNQWNGPIHEPMVFPNYYVDSVINIYVVQTISAPSNIGGYAYMPGGPDVIVLQKANLTDLTPVHEMGHFFGLPHTFETAGGSELVNESNCATSGDGFCDTEADPHPAGENDNEPCSFTYGPQDPNGNYYTPPVDNIMTYYKNCRCRFTQQQYNHMAYMYATVRNYLH